MANGELEKKVKKNTALFFEKLEFEAKKYISLTFIQIQEQILIHATCSID